MTEGRCVGSASVGFEIVLVECTLGVIVDGGINVVDGVIVDGSSVDDGVIVDGVIVDGVTVDSGNVDGGTVKRGPIRPGPNQSEPFALAGELVKSTIGDTHNSSRLLW